MEAEAPVALITGSARRLGAAIAEALHARGYRTVIHYRSSAAEAQALAGHLNGRRAESACALEAELNDLAAIEDLARRSLSQWGRLDLLVNNASSFYPTPLEASTEADWDDLMASNLRAPFFLTKHLAPALREAGGAVVNLADVYAERPRRNYPIYNAAKAGLVALTKSLARDLAPEVRVNAVAPGAILWSEPSGGDKADADQPFLARVPLGRMGEPSDIAGAVVFLACDAPYITGQVLQVDGGRSVDI